jgi:phosphatidylserine/phosphatidylglycerophosphate/cardiolipin synthase-like enzyme
MGFSFLLNHQAMQNAVAFSNNDVITIAWSYGKKPTGCLGFAVYRIDEQGNEEPLPSQAVFEGQTKANGQTTAQFPIQKFYWKDVYARLIAEKKNKRKFRYKIVPLKGKPGKLVPMTELAMLITNEVEITPILEDNVRIYFNRGLISTQRVARFLTEKNKKQSLLESVAKLDNPLRASLSGDMVEGLMEFMAKAKTNGKIYAALYELGDAELIAGLTSLKKRLHIVLSNSRIQIDDKTKPKYKNKNDDLVYHKITLDGNQDARDALKKTTPNLWDRIMPDGHIGHNKFLVYVDKDNKPQSVLLGSTNWTSTGLCTQTNNTIVIDDINLARRYMKYWNALKKDSVNAKGTPKDLQGIDLRTWGTTGLDLEKIANIPLLHSWFSPNTPKARSSKKTGEKCPPDMAQVIDYINGAKHAILFLAFYPGAPSLANWTAAALKKKKDLFVRGCVTNKSASEGFYYELKGTTPPPKVKGEKRTIKQDNRVIGAEAFDGTRIPASWKKEILNAGFAIIHDKVMVIDPFSKDCVVITGSHNLGYKASYDNDENLAIIKGNRLIAMAYATHVLDVYDHFSFRKWFKENGKTEDYFLEKDPERWLGKYFDNEGKIKNPQLKFWMESTNELG